MAYFPDEYYTAMDRSYAPAAPSVGGHGGGHGGYGSSPESEMNSLGLEPGNIGISAAPFQDQLQQLRAKIFQGVKIVELGFMGKGKGSMQGGNTTPEMFGADERRDMRELARWNKVTLSVHATPNAGSLAGFAQNRFDDGAREQTYNEIRRAIDFAADTTEGGPVVVHAQEFPREILGNFDQFRAYPEEDKKAVRHLVDDRTGQLTSEVRKNDFVHEPLYEEDENGNWKTIDGKTIAKDFVPKEKGDFELMFNRIPVWDNTTTSFKTAKRDFSYFEQRANEIKAKTGRVVQPEELFYRSQIENQILQAKGSSLFYGRQYEEIRDRWIKTSEALEFYKKLEARTDLTEDDRRGLMTERGYGPFVPNTREKITEHLERAKKEWQDNLRQIHQASASADVNAAQLQQVIQNVKTIKEYAVDKTAETIARAGLYAMEKEQRIPRESARGSERMEKPLYIAVENFFPEVYGGHPQEIREIIERSRAEMTKRLVSERHMSQSEAAKQAENHIKMTWDTGHANIWRKYFQPEGNETPEQTDIRFKKWYLEQAEDLAKRKMIGNVHVSDNFGWEDEHVTPGQGIAPIKEFIEVVKKHGVENVIVEPAHQDVRALRGALGLFGAGVYGLPNGRRDTWADIEHSYFGRTATPYFLYGENAPRADEWSFWSATPIE